MIEQTEQGITLAVEHRLLLLRVEAMERELNTFKQGDQRTRDKDHQNPDEEWRCAKCGYFLGLYDPEADELRMRYKDFHVWVHIGVGGFLTTVCRGCAEQNTEVYVSQADTQPGAVG